MTRQRKLSKSRLIVLYVYLSWQVYRHTYNRVTCVFNKNIDLGYAEMAERPLEIVS